ncbi:MAG: aldehyde ferredoxin oxidoreductase family protein [Desulfobacter sp.]|nr:MAG: aldehyde ferredoxin oxidoreductase family protein [Desulfobacter sp.]
MFGFYNLLLRVNASQESFEITSLQDSVLEQKLGGKGLATHLLLENNPAGVNPLSPDNHLIFTTGPMSGTSLWGSCRYGVYTKSPQTGFYSESYSGGTVGEYIAATGMDAIMIHGKADRPVWLEVSDASVAFHPADDLVGLDSMETEDRVKDWIKKNRSGKTKCGVITIGPAGENLVSFAVIENDYWRSAGRTGVGAVMGSKNIKAIAFRGNAKKTVAHPGIVKAFNKTLAKRSKDDPGVFAYKTMGTPMLVDIMHSVKGFPSEYWKKGTVPHQDQINAKALHERCEVKPSSCLKCFMACGRLSTVKEGRHKGLTLEGPEYETIYAFGGLCGVETIEDIIFLNDKCDRLGMDTITGGNLAAFTIEAVRQGRVKYDIDYGQTDKISNLLKDISARKGIGDILAKGIIATAREWDMEDQAIHVKGLEPAGYDPRVLPGMGLAYGSSPRGACHLRATFYKPELAGIVEKDKIEGKAEVFAEWEDRLTLFDTFILCRFYRDMYQWEELSTMIKGVTGLELDTEGMRKIATTVSDDIRRFNIREGLIPEDDHLPKRFHKEFLPETNRVITRDTMNQLLKEYYKARGWDETGKPGE